jgi:hypothetical protein
MSSTSKIYELDFKYGSSTEKFRTRIKDLAELQAFVLNKLKSKYKINQLDVGRVVISHDELELKLGGEEDLVVINGSDSWEIFCRLEVAVYHFGTGISAMMDKKPVFGAVSIQPPIFKNSWSKFWKA